MNEHLKKLVNAATEKRPLMVLNPETFESYHATDYYTGKLKYYDFFDREKFAELIIKECLDIMTKEEYNTTLLTCNPMASGAISDARYYIKERFGIK